jgi:hypothetical protein
MCVHALGKLSDSESDLELVINSLWILPSNHKSHHPYHVLPNIRTQYRAIGAGAILEKVNEQASLQERESFGQET